MAKGAEKKKTNALIDTNVNNSQNYTTGYLNDSAGERTQARSNADDMYGTMSKGYTGLANGSAISPQLLAAMNASGSGGGGGYVPDFNSGDFGKVKASYNNFMGGGGVNLANNNYAMDQLKGLASTGGWDPSRVASMDQNIQGLKGIGQTGGVSAADQARIRGNGVFDEFANTGGYSQGDIQDAMARGTSVIPAFYQQAMQEAQRQAGITGSNNPAAIASMSRTAAQQAQDAARDTRLGINDQIRSNRMAGATSLSGAEQGLQGLLSQNKLAGLTGAGSMEANMLNSIAQNRTGAASSLGNLDIGGQSLIQQGKEFGTQGLEGLASKEASARASAASAGAASNAQNLANQKWLAQFGLDAQLSGLGGLGNLYTSAPAEVFDYDKQRQSAVGQNAQIAGGSIDQRMQNNPQRDWLSTIGKLGGAVVGGMTGLSGIGNAAGQIGNVKNFKQYL